MKTKLIAALTAATLMPFAASALPDCEAPNYLIVTSWGTWCDQLEEIEMKGVDMPILVLPGDARPVKVDGEAQAIFDKLIKK